MGRQEHDTENASKIEVIQGGGGSAARECQAHPVDLGLYHCEEQGGGVWSSRH